MTEITGQLDGTRPLSDINMESLAARSALLAARNMWIGFGVDIDDADSVRNFNNDLAYLRSLRQSSERFSNAARNAGWGILVVVLGTGIIAAFGWISTRIGMAHP